MSIDTLSADTGKQRVDEALIENVSVTIQAFVGEAVMTVAELQALRPDDIVPLRMSLNDLVELRLNGTPIARGELVAVGEKFGVRIISMSR